MFVVFSLTYSLGTYHLAENLKKFQDKKTLLPLQAL